MRLNGVTWNTYRTSVRSQIDCKYFRNSLLAISLCIPICRCCYMCSQPGDRIHSPSLLQTLWLGVLVSPSCLKSQLVIIIVCHLDPDLETCFLRVFVPWGIFIATGVCVFECLMWGNSSIMFSFPNLGLGNIFHVETERGNKFTVRPVP